MSKRREEPLAEAVDGVVRRPLTARVVRGGAVQGVAVARLHISRHRVHGSQVPIGGRADARSPQRRRHAEAPAFGPRDRFELRVGHGRRSLDPRLPRETTRVHASGDEHRDRLGPPRIKIGSVDIHGQGGRDRGRC